MRVGEIWAGRWRLLGVSQVALVGGGSRRSNEKVLVVYLGVVVETVGLVLEEEAELEAAVSVVVVVVAVGWSGNNW